VSAAKWYIILQQHMISVSITRVAGAGVCGLEAWSEPPFFLETAQTAPAFLLSETASFAALLSSNLNDGGINVWNMQARRAAQTSKIRFCF
jgi:hypothetical protein